MFCSQCGTEISDSQAPACPACGNALNSSFRLSFTVLKEMLTNAAGRKYPVLRLLVTVFKLAAVVVVFFGLISAAVRCTALPAYGSFSVHLLLVSISVFFGSLVLAVVLWAFGEGFAVFLDIEENLRRLAANKGQ